MKWRRNCFIFLLLLIGTTKRGRWERNAAGEGKSQFVATSQVKGTSSVLCAHCAKLRKASDSNCNNNTISFCISISYEYFWLIRKTQVRDPYLKLYGLSFSTQIYGLKISMQVISLGAKTWLICSLQYRFSSEMEVASKILTS